MSAPTPATSERAPLLSHSATAQQHRLASPSIRFPLAGGSSSSAERHYNHNCFVDDDRPPGNASDPNAGSVPTLIDWSAEEQQDGFGEMQKSDMSAQQQRRMGIKRDDSKVYTSFPRPLYSPWEERTGDEDDEALAKSQADRSFLSRLLPSYSSATASSSREPKTTGSSRRQYSGSSAYTNGDLEEGELQRPGVPKLTRECFIAEFKCYGYYVFWTVLVFVVIALAIALGIYWRNKH